MGFIGEVLNFFRLDRFGVPSADVTVDPGGGGDGIESPNQTAEHFSPAGDDSRPLPGDYAVVVEVPGEGEGAVVGYLDPANAGVAEGGEKRIYARDANGNLAAEVHLQADGTILINNGSGFCEYTPGGDVEYDVNKLFVGAAAALRRKVGRDLDPVNITPATDPGFIGYFAAMQVYMLALAGPPLGPSPGAIDPTVRAAANAFLAAIPVPPTTIAGQLAASSTKLEVE